MASYLLIIADREALGWVLTTRQMAFRSGDRREVRQLRRGDELFLYTTRGAFRNPTRDRGRVIGTAEVTSSVAASRRPVQFGGREYPFACRIALGPVAPLGRGIEIATLVPQLQAFAGAGRSWSVRMRRPLLEITTCDASVLKHELSKVDQSVEAVSGYTRWYAATLRSAGKTADSTAHRTAPVVLDALNEHAVDVPDDLQGL